LNVSPAPIFLPLTQGATLPEQTITIVGAGIGGLVLGIALQQRGRDVVIYEATDVLDEVGAGVALWSNATRLLHRLGLADELAEHGSEPTELIFRDGIDGSRIADYNLTGGDWYREEFGAPYYGIHRKTLQKILVDARSGDGLPSKCRHDDRNLVESHT
jgi:salicylate hydroxylase